MVIFNELTFESNEPQNGAAHIKKEDALGQHLEREKQKGKIRTKERGQDSSGGLVLYNWKVQ